MINSILHSLDSADWFYSVRYAVAGYIDTKYRRRQSSHKSNYEISVYHEVYVLYAFGVMLFFRSICNCIAPWRLLTNSNHVRRSIDMHFMTR